MSLLLNALNASTVKTENGDAAYASTYSKVLDFFYKAAASRDKNLVPDFEASLAESKELTLRVMLWLRDAREGAGERQTFKNLLNYVATQHPSLAVPLVHKIPELGRYDDFLCLWGTELEGLAVALWLRGMSEENALAFKWAPRKDRKGAKPLRTACGLTEQLWRKLVVSGSDTVEQKLCARDFESINFEQVPSVAMARYSKSLTKNSKSFDTYKKLLESGEAKVNAGAIFPHDIVKSVKQGNTETANAQWASLPNYLEGSKYKNILPVVDVSGSMNTKVSGSTTAMDVAISLGIYVSERAEGFFKDAFLTFSETPKLQILKGDLRSRITQLDRAEWGYNTNIRRVFSTLLSAAVQHNVPAHEMPDLILIPSDMQFDRGCTGTGHLVEARRNFEAAGYKVPDLVYWNMDVREGSIPTTVAEPGTAIVSGFSPSLLKGVLAGNTDPIDTMLRIIGVERYSISKKVLARN